MPADARGHRAEAQCQPALLYQQRVSSTVQGGRAQAWHPLPGGTALWNYLVPLIMSIGKHGVGRMALASISMFNACTDSWGYHLP